MGAWIEIGIGVTAENETRSLPVWERGLKSQSAVATGKATIVAPGMGAWIEMALVYAFAVVAIWSLPVWERGLKSD